MLLRLLKDALKAIRASQPFNSLVTTILRRMFSVSGHVPEVVVRHLPRVGITACSLPNGRMLLLESRGDDWISNQIYWKGWAAYEGETSWLFFRLAQRESVVIDVGAHVGFYALVAGLANGSARVYAFEPFPPTYERLVRHVALNDLSNVQCIQSAVGAKDGTATFFHQREGIPSSAGLGTTLFHDRMSEMCSLPVPIVTLDSFMTRERISRAGLIKIDTEGTEPDVLRGAGRILERDHPVIICEVLPGTNTERALEEILGPLGYRYYHLTPQGPFHRDRIVPDANYLNYLFSVMDPKDLSATLSA